MAVRAAILLSRQPLRPCGRTPWVRNSRQAVEWVKRQHLGLLSSIGMQTWEMVTALASLDRIPLCLYLTEQVSGKPERESVEHDFQLTTDTTCFRVVPHSDLSNRQILPLRDSLIVEDADILMPVSIRRNGHMERLVEEARKCGKDVIEQFLVEERSKPEALAMDFGRADINPALDLVKSGFAIHWTRASNDKWPGERSIDYYRAIIESSVYPRSGFETLRHIIRERKICASSRHMPKQIATVSLSTLAPREVIPLMRWRARYAQMSFEPYGIGIRAEFASALGIRPVWYHNKTERANEAEEIWLSQSIGEKSDWRQEHECRHLGDLQLGGIPRESLHLFCRSKAEAEMLEAEFSLPTTHLFF